MGEDKALLPFGSFSTLTQYQYDRLSKIFLYPYISCKDSSKFPFDANFIEENTDIYAPTAGFIAAFEYLNCDRFFAISVDAPFIHEDIIAKLIEDDKTFYDATIASSPNGIEPLCGIYHKSLLPQFITMQNSNQHRLISMLKSTKTQFVDFENQHSFLNLNRPQDYQKALKLLK
jgi:molybdopterin-guanine dinucleotide biosynthesis protein A